VNTSSVAKRRRMKVSYVHPIVAWLMDSA